MDSIARLGFTFSLLLIQSLFPFSISASPQRHLLQLSSQSPQNLQTFPSTAIPAFINPTPPPPPPLLPPPPAAAASSPSDSDNGHIAAAVIGTAASSFALYGFLFFAFYRFTKKKRRGLETRVYSSDAAAAAAATAGGDVNTFRSKPEPTIKGVIVDDNGLDVLYWRNLEDTAARRRCDHCNSIVDRGRYMDDDEVTESPEPRRRRRVKGGEVMTQGTPLLPSDSVSSSSQVFAQTKALNRNSTVSIASLELVSHSPPAAPPPPPPPPARRKPPNPPAPPIKMSPAPPPLPVRRAAAASLPQLGSEGGAERPRLKPLHWEKVTPTRAGHSMVWDRINDGSIKFDDDQMEALFGYISTNPNLPKTNSGESSTSTAGAGVSVSSPISLLDARKSQNIAIILRTLATSRHDILESLHHGNGLAADTLEKLSRITLTKDEESLIISFSGDPIHLTDADSFLFQLLQTFPSAFPRILAMHFRSCVYNPEILHLKQSLQTLELACKELRTKGLFLKLLEAILKAGNRMNAGTARGNAQAFDLTALRKLSDVKSTDGKTTLLHFVVEEVVRSEGKRCAAIKGTLGEERERDFVTLGLPVVGELSSEFMNVKTAAALDPESMAASCSTMAERVIDIRNFLGKCVEKEEGFFREMMGFVETAGKEMEEVKEEQWRVMEIVKRTTAYYQLGAALKEKEGKPSLQIFVIVRDFLAMVDQACVDISRNVQRRKKQTPLEKEKRITARFPNLPARFMADNSISCSDSDEEF